MKDISRSLYGDDDEVSLFLFDESPLVEDVSKKAPHEERHRVLFWGQMDESLLSSETDMKYEASSIVLSLRRIQKRQCNRRQREEDRQ